MSFLYPAFLLGALAVAIPVVLHLLRRDVAPEVPFSAVRLLRRSPIERTHRRRLRDLLLLAARVAALLLLAAAFARPFMAAGSAPSPLRIIAIDRSFSMGAPQRFPRALELARAAIDDAGMQARVAVIAFDDRAQVIAAPGSAADARAALTALAPGFGGTRFTPVLDQAVELASGDPARLTVISDLQRAGWEGAQPVAVPASLSLEVKAVAEPPANIALTNLRVSADRVTASVRNTGPAPVTAALDVRVDGRPAASAQATAAPASVADVVIPYRAPASGALSVTVEDAAGYAADNVRYAVLDALPRARVLVIGGDRAQAGFYLSRALDAERDDAPFAVQVVSGATLSGMSSAQVAGHASLVLLSTRGLDRRGREALAAYVRGGGGLLVAAAPDLEPAVLTTTMNWPEVAAVEHEAGAVTLSATDLRHPIFRPFGSLAANLGQVRFARTWRLRADGWDVAARFTDGSAALVERRDGAGRVVIFASDLDRRWNDFPLHPAFVPFAVETLRYVGGDRDRRREYLVGEAPPGVEPRPGVYRAPPDGRPLAVNVDSRESASDRIAADEFAAMVQHVERPAAGSRRDVQARQTEERQNYWRYGVMLMLAVLVAESVVGRP